MNNLLNNSKLQTSLIVLFLVVAAIFLHSNYINESPMYVHAWAQSDRLSIALNFLNNNFNLFYPESHIFNPEFPNNWLRANQESIGAVDLPIHDYLAAFFMVIFNSKEPAIFRTYTLIYSLIGLLFLYKLTLTLSGSQFKSKLITLLAATSPVFIYYQSGFLPTIPSLANVIIGYYFYVTYLKEEKTKSFYLSILFLTLATLNRTSFAIPLIALFCHQFLLVFSNSKNLKPKLYAVAASILSIGLYYIHNTNLRNKYGSNFLNHLLPSESWEETDRIFNRALEVWTFEYFSLIHYYIFGAIILLVLITLILKKSVSNSINKTFLLLITIYIFGTICFSAAMFVQFENHDYYFLDSWYLPLIFLFIGLIAYTPNVENLYIRLGTELTLPILLFFLVANGRETQNNRYSYNDWDYITKSSKSFEGSNQMLEDLNIPLDAKILVIDNGAPNIPFIRMDRKGYPVIDIKKETIDIALNWDFDYIAFTDESFERKIYPEYPELLTHLEKIGDNGYVSICKYSHEPINQTYASFFSETSTTPAFTEELSFDSEAKNYWKDLNVTQKEHFSGNQSGSIDSTQEYGISYSRTDLTFLKKKPTVLKINLQIKTSKAENSLLIFAIEEDGESTFYQAVNLMDVVSTDMPNDWQKIVCTYNLPKVKSDNFKVACYLWNKGRNNFYFDDLKLNFY